MCILRKQSYTFAINSILFIMKKLVLLTLFLSFNLLLIAQNGKPYQIFNAKGKKVSYKKMIKQLSKTDIVLFGEFHNNSIIHWLQISATKDLHQKRALILGAEMLEADNQNQLNDYLTGKIDHKGLDSLARLWSNYKTDYKPLVDFAKKNELEFIATNIPRRYAKIVYKKGIEALDTLPKLDKSWIVPLPMAYDGDLPGYANLKKMMGGHGGDNFPKAQAIKDATMAHFIVENYKKDKLFLHYNGAYHSDGFEAISWYINKFNNTLNIKTISTVEQDDLKKLIDDNKNKANFIIVVPKDMTKTY